MSSRLKSLSGRDVVRSLTSLGFAVVRTRGSHATLVRINPEDGQRQVLTVPLHKEIARRTLYAIHRQALRFVSAENLRPYFFHD